MKKHKKLMKIATKSFSNTLKNFAKFSNYLIKEEQDFVTTFSFLASNFNLKLFREPYKFKTLNILKHMNPLI